MDTFRKWLNKPKADDKSLLARFYHADRSLTAVANELDSFDGRAEPDRCSRLVSRLRQSQDKVLAITNLIMDELLGEDRDARAFRAKFPEEVLQENLAGQLWFGAECLAAGSSIMNREQESKEMRPLAQAVTKSLGNVRNLLRDQCLRNNVPNSRTLHLDHNDTTTEQLCESLKIFDRLFAEFELRYVSAMVQVKTKHEYEMQEMICVLFSETLQRALSIGLLEQDKVDAFDPALMFSIPRLAIIAGLVIYHKGPLNMDMAADQLSEMFRPFRTILIKIRDHLRTLDKNELYQLERLLCTNEEIHLKVNEPDNSKEASGSCDKRNNNENNQSNTTKNLVEPPVTIGDNQIQSTTQELKQLDNNNTSSASQPSSTLRNTSLSSATGNGLGEGVKVGAVEHDRKSVYAAIRMAQSSPHSIVSGDCSVASTPSVSPAASPTPSHSIASTSSALSTSTTSPTDWTDDDDDDAPYTDEQELDSESPKELDIVSADCASGFLIPNTNFGNLLQPQEVPLTDNFIASEDEFASNHTDVEEDTHDVPLDLPSTSSASLRNRIASQINADSSEDSEALTIKASVKSSECSSASTVSGVSKCENDDSWRSTSCVSGSSQRPPNHQHHHHHHHHHHFNERRREEVKERNGSSTVSDISRRHHHHHHSHSHPHRHHHHHHHHHHQHQRQQHSKTKRSNEDDDIANGQGQRLNSITADVTSAEESKTANATTGATESTTDWSSGKQKQPSKNEYTSSAESSSSSSLSDGDPHEVSLAIRAAGRLKFKSTENLLHRLFVCIAGVADQLQTNFASDLRQILRSVFLMNMSSAQEEIIDIPEKPKESELFEFRASENDVIQESAGSNQSIYSAEEVNPESDNVFNNGNSGGSAGIQRVNTVDLGSVSQTAVVTSARNHIGRSRSLGDQENNERTITRVGDSTNNNRNLNSYVNGRRLSSPPRQMIVQQQQQQQQQQQLSLRNRNRNNSVGTNSSASSTSSSSSESYSPVSERIVASTSVCPSATPVSSTSSTTAVINHSNNNNIENATSTNSTQGQALRLAPPAWIPDEKAPRCMSCHTPFTAFRRRHHCRNCGGVFCGVCSSSSAPLPKYGLTKAVRMCRDCYMREVRGAVSAIRNTVTAHTSAATATASLTPTTTAGGS